MQYLFATEDRDFSDLASGFVLQSAPGSPAFPARVASELFLRALADLGQSTVSLLDPCCGSAYALTVLGLLHPGEIARIGASDIDPRALDLARTNLSLLSAAGLARRKEELQRRVLEYGRPVYQQALAAIERIAASRGGVVEPATCVQVADAADPPSLATAFQGQTYDLAFVDLPYGERTHWQEEGADWQSRSPVEAVARSCRPLLRPGGVLIVVNRRAVPRDPDGFRRMRKLRCRGRRDALFYLRT